MICAIFFFFFFKMGRGGWGGCSSAFGGSRFRDIYVLVLVLVLVLTEGIQSNKFFSFGGGQMCIYI
jgi:hypothetical protein